MNELLDWVEKAGQENIKFRIANAEALAKEAAVMLTILLAGIGGAMTIASKYYEVGKTWTEIAYGAASVAVWLMLLAGVLLQWCIKTKPLAAPSNEPKNIFQPAFSLEAIRQVEIQNLQARIEDITERNRASATWLDRVRYAAICSPLIFVIGALGLAAANS